MPWTEAHRGRSRLPLAGSTCHRLVSWGGCHVHHRRVLTRPGAGGKVLHETRRTLGPVGEGAARGRAPAGLGAGGAGWALHTSPFCCCPRKPFSGKGCCRWPVLRWPRGLRDASLHGAGRAWAGGRVLWGQTQMCQNAGRTDERRETSQRSSGPRRFASSRKGVSSHVLDDAGRARLEELHLEGS